LDNILAEVLSYNYDGFSDALDLSHPDFNMLIKEKNDDE
jgi:hypothetical protein